MTDDLGGLFGGVVVPEATPSPRTVRFATPPIGDGPSRSFTRDDASTDPAVARIFAVSDDVTGVLVGPDFVAVTLARPDAWESSLAQLLEAVADGFTDPAPASRATDEPAGPAPGPGGPTAEHAPRRLERAWSDLGAATDDAERVERVERIFAATDDPEAERRQVAAVLLADMDPVLARRHWARLVVDPSRSVRRAAVDAMGDATREDLRPLLEQALDDADPWTRWRAVRAIAQLGAGASRTAVANLATDPDFRVRLEAARVVAD